MSEPGPPSLPVLLPGGKPKPRILAVDDQPDSLRLLQLRVQAADMECITCQDGASALDYVEKNAVDVIILDVMMPGLDGFEVCRRLKANVRTQDIPVIFLTSRMDPTDKVRGLEVGGHDYLSKPVEQQELVARTRAALRVKRLQDQLKGELSLRQHIDQLHQAMLSSHWLNTFGQLASSLAHEINNPIAAAMGGIELLALKDILPESALNRIQLIDQSLQRAGQKLRSLLLIARSQKDPQETQLASLLTDLTTVVNLRLIMNKITLKLDLHEGCAWVGLLSELARAILYLLNNAIEAVTGEADATIWLTLKKFPESYLISVADNGTGIAAEHTSLVFDPFFTTKGQPHSGLGLHLAKEIIDLAGGAIRVAEHPQHGTTEIVLSLPTGHNPLN